jgi:sigma-B regulation protein RsbU (phosphoserine phosphatase)
MRFKQQLRALSIVNRIFVIALVLRVVYTVIETATGTQLPASPLVRVLFFFAAVAFLFVSFPKLLRKLLWRVRHRLLVTWVLVGVVPIVLICALLAEGAFFLMGQLVGYMTTTEITRQSELVRGAAESLAWSLAHRGPSVAAPSLTETFVRELAETRKSDFGAIVRTGNAAFAVPAVGDIQAIPEWSKPDFAGLVKGQESRIYFAAQSTVGPPPDKTDVFLYRHASKDFFKKLLPDVAIVEIDRGNVTRRAGGIEFTRNETSRSGISYKGSRQASDPDLRPEVPPARSWWDFSIEWFVLTPITDLNTGKDDRSLAIVTSRPSLVMRKLFSTLGNAATIVIVLMGFTAGALLIVETASIVFGATLTRSITRAVSDIYEGTRKVQAGDFSHRIPVRKNKDQLSELATSFNAMTDRIQGLIVEVREKERIQNELKIARDVQFSLFPKELPHLKTLELWGGCEPARTVSGDYYDFLRLDANRVALAIGDISGKGISAALLMATIQSALRSQFTHRNFGDSTMNGVSTSNILSILNDHVYTSSPPEKYATFFLGLYADDTSELIYTNAGHLAPLLVRRGQVQRLIGEGFPIGLFPGVQYSQQSISLEAGDLVVAFTDGVTEAPNRTREEFGEQRVGELLLRNADRPLDRIAEELISSVTAWSGDVERYDDTTLVLARRI